MECNTPNGMSTMDACILRVCCCTLLVQDLDTCQEVLVHTGQACCFCPGERVVIEYNGIMALSQPPQISARRIRRASCGSCCGDCCC